MFNEIPELNERYCFYFCQANEMLCDDRHFRALEFIDKAEKHADSDYCINEIKEARKTINKAIADFADYMGV